MALFDTGYKEYAKGVDYSSISNLGDLQKARNELTNKIQIKETELNFQYKAIKDFFNPATYINRFVSQFATVENIVRCFCRGFTVARNIINEYKQNNQNSQNDHS